MTEWFFIAPKEEKITKSAATCGICGRLLTDPESVAKGIGPVCEAHGVERSFPGHKGRPGKVGGSLPRKVGAKPKVGGGKGEGDEFSGSEGAPRAYAATVHGQRLATRTFIRGIIIPALKKVIAAQRPYRRSQGAWRRLEKERDILADAKAYDRLQRPRYSRMETYTRAAKVAEKYMTANDAENLQRRRGVKR